MNILRRINRGFVVGFLVISAICAGGWYLVYLFVKLIAKGMGWA